MTDENKTEPGTARDPGNSWRPWAKYAIPVAVFVTAMVLTDLRWHWTSLTYETVEVPDYVVMLRQKTLWDWFELLVVPLAVAITVGFIGWTGQRSDRRIAEERANKDRELAEEHAKKDRSIAEDQNREAALQAYLEKMSMLLLDVDHHNHVESRIPDVARVWTLTTLRRVDGERKRIIVQFLAESGLINSGDPIVALTGANLREAYLSEADLEGVDFSGANLRGANLRESNLTGADFTTANLTRADLARANLKSARLDDATLNGAILEKAQLDGASLIDSKMAGTEAPETRFQSADLSSAKLNKTVLHGANLTNVTMHGATIEESDLSEALLWDTDLSESVLCQVNLDGACLRGTKLALETAEDLTAENVLYGDSTEWPQSFSPPASAVNWDTAPDQQKLAWVEAYQYHDIPPAADEPES